MEVATQAPPSAGGLKLAMPFSVTLEGSDTPLEGKVRIPDFVAMERHFGRPAAAMKDEPYMDWMLFGVHHALVRTKTIDLDYETFLDRLEVFDMTSNPEAAGAGEQADADAVATTPPQD